jgi:pimeloyl-ACP methyl ester carboxylesterase
MEVESRGFKIHYLSAGDGPPLLLIPGSLQSAARWRDLRYLDTLAADFRVLAVDPLGQGGSDKPHESENYTEPEVVEDLVAVLDRDEAEQAHVWGYGRGAHHAFLLARDNPERVLSVTAGGYSPSAAPARRGHLLRVAGALRSGDLERALELLDVNAVNRALLMDNDAIAEAGAVEMTFMDPIAPDQLRRLPVLLYCGSREPFVEEARADASTMGGRFEELADRGHGGAFEAADLVLPMVLDHLGVRPEAGGESFGRRR